MDIDQLAQELRRMYNRAPEGDRVAMIHLFAIKRADEIRNMSTPEIARRAGLSRSYATEISKGRRLARYVDVKPQWRG